jgi:cytochrome c oxidase cbb3-type subunit 1
MSSARLLLVRWPVSGGVQPAIALWFAHNLTVVWVSLMGLAFLFYFLPKLSGRPLASRGMALFTFWGLVLLGGWGGVHSAAPLPRWLSAVSTASNVLMMVPVLAAGMNYRQTIGGREDAIREQPGGRFFLVASIGDFLWGLVQAGSTISSVNEVAEFTHFATAIHQGGLIAVLGLALFGAIYYIAPRLTGGDWPLAQLVSLQTVAALSGVILYLGSLTGAGIMQGFALNDPAVSFFESTRRSLMFFRLSTLGDLLLLVGAVTLFVNLVALLWQGARQCCLGAAPVNSKSKTAGATV